MPGEDLPETSCRRAIEDTLRRSGAGTTREICAQAPNQGTLTARSSERIGPGARRRRKRHLAWTESE